MDISGGDLGKKKKKPEKEKDSKFMKYVNPEFTVEVLMQIHFPSMSVSIA